MGFPQLVQEDLDVFDRILGELMLKSEAMFTMIVEKAGYLIHQHGPSNTLDTTTLATLGSNAFNATNFMAQLVNENNFTSLYQQGDSYNTLIVNIDENCLLVIVFGSDHTVGSMKYYAAQAVKQLGDQVKVADLRGNPELDLADMDTTDVQALFKKQ